MEKEILQKNIESYTLINEAKKYTEKNPPKTLGGEDKQVFIWFLAHAQSWDPPGLL